MTTHSDDAGSLDRLVGGRVAWYMKHDNGPVWTQTRLAPVLGIDQSTLSKKLKGERPFTLTELYTIADCLGVGMESLTPSRQLLGAPPVPTQRAAPTAAETKPARVRRSRRVSTQDTAVVTDEYTASARARRSLCATGAPRNLALSA